MKRRMKRVILLFLVALLLSSCSTADQTVAASQPAAINPAPTGPAVEHAAVFEVTAWVDDPDPPAGTRVILHGSLLKDGVHLGGMAMQATWPDEAQERGVPNCRVQVIYGAGVCIVDGVGFQPGVYVPITVTFEYQGRLYSGRTGFTPR